MGKYLISVCIPSYNRPLELGMLLRSIDCNPKWGVQIVICEDNSPKRLEIRKEVELYQKESNYDVKYIENIYNLGYDGNIRELIKKSDGDYIVYMGDDDQFITGKLNKLCEFIKENNQLGYILRSYRNNYKNGEIEYYRYYIGNTFFEAGEKAYIDLFRKSVFISGFTFKRELAIPTLTDIFDGTLLYQLYVQAEICLNYPSAYFDEPITQANEGGQFYFGNSVSEKKLYTPNKHTVTGETNFISSFFKITEFIDRKYNINSTIKIKNDMSKYSFPMLALVSENGKSDLKEYYRQLKKLGFGCTKFFKFYYYSLIILGPIICRKLIRIIKKVIGRTPQL